MTRNDGNHSGVGARKSDDLLFQRNDDRDQSKFPTFRDKMPSVNDRNDDILIHDPHAVVSSLMKTSDQEREMAYDQEENDHALFVNDQNLLEEGGGPIQDTPSLGSEALTNNIDNLNNRYNTNKPKADLPVDQSNTDYMNSRYHLSTQQRIELANRLSDPDQQSNQRLSINSGNKGDRNSGSKSQRSGRLSKADRLAKKMSQSNPFNNSTVSNEPEKTVQVASVVRKDRAVPHLSLNIVGNTLMAAKNQTERLKDTTLKGVTIRPKPEKLKISDTA